jgi:hypothetical protein
MNEAGSPLQFDRAVPDSISDMLRERVAATCEACGAAIDTEYYQINGHVVCTSCRGRAEMSAETPDGIGPMLIAGVYGLGAGIVGAIIYYAVLALLNLEIGIVAILIGYMVGYAIRKGAHGRGGRRFQLLAVGLTYASIALAYTPVVLKAAIDKDRVATKSSVSSNVETPQPAAANAPEQPARSGSTIVALGAFFLFALALPVLVVVSSLPGGLISAAIMFFGMSQAWKMTAAPQLSILGPFRVGGASEPQPA